MNKFITGLFLLIITYTSQNKIMAQQTIRYVALGDSYTIGTGAKEATEAWPILLTKHLKENKINIELIANPAINGFTTQRLIDYELPILDQSKPTFVTLLIGVNDWVQGVDAVTFQNNLIFIIDHIQKQLADKSKLVLITIPDFGVTPTGANYSAGRDIAEGIAAFNLVITSEADKRKLKTIDLFELSKGMKTDRTLIAQDGLHPSAKEYALWETHIYQVIYALLK
jgi:lysophospholipase L1-like esterase